MDFTIPVTFRNIVDEIVKLTCSPKEEVEERVWMEAIDPGWNVNRDIVRFQATPHHYDEKMATVYRDGNGFIYETLVFWAKPYRQRWIQSALDRILLYAKRAAVDPGRLRILMLGDGTGNDSLCLAKSGLKVDYFDVPGSKTFDFALKRFKCYGLLGDSVHVLTDYSLCLSGEYNVVVSFEVLEHLPQPLAAIRDMSRMLKTTGIALVTEAFGGISENLPTHLRANAKYAGRTPFLFLSNGMVLSWYSREQLCRPMEFTRFETSSIRHFMSLLTDRTVVTAWLLSKIRRLKGWLGISAL